MRKLENRHCHCGKTLKLTITHAPWQNTADLHGQILDALKIISAVPARATVKKLLRILKKEAEMI
jgi:hypothetical protein